MTTNRPEFKAHDDFIFGHKKIGKVTREVFIKYIRSTHDQIRKLIQIIQQYSQTIELFEENERTRESAESERVSNEAERISKDSERDSKIEAVEDNLESKANKQQEEWISPTLINGAEETRPVGFMKDEFGFVHLKGGLIPRAPDVFVFRFPNGYTPSSSIFEVIGLPKERTSGTTVISRNGLFLYMDFTDKEISLDGISFSTK